MRCCNSHLAQNLECLAAMPRVGINRAGYHASDSGSADGLRAGGRATVRAARLQRHVQRGAFDVVPLPLRVVERLDFRVGFPCPVMPAPANDPVSPHQDRPHHGIG